MITISNKCCFFNFLFIKESNYQVSKLFSTLQYHVTQRTGVSLIK